MTDENDSPPVAVPSMFATLTDAEREQLSRVLFPETDTVEVEVLGKTRDLRPLPVRQAAVLKKAIKPMVDDLERGLQATQADPKADYDAEDQILKALEKATKVLADFYHWTDVLEALSGDGVPLSEMQALAVTQVKVNGTNDFLLAGLRTVVRWMQIAEMMMVRFQNTLTGQLS